MRRRRAWLVAYSECLLPPALPLSLVSLNLLVLAVTLRFLCASGQPVSRACLVRISIIYSIVTQAAVAFAS